MTLVLNHLLPLNGNKINLKICSLKSLIIIAYLIMIKPFLCKSISSVIKRRLIVEIIKNRQMRKITMFIFLLTCSTVLLAMQQPTIQHTVSKGETIYSLTKRYQITEEVLYRYNPQIRSGLQANAVIEIPSVAFQQEPTSFIEHKVKRKETLFSLAQEYHVSIDQIKKYNSELYARDLNRGEVIRIPVFQKGKQNQLKIG